MIKAVVFDLDNTLVDSMKMKEATVSAVVLAMTDCGQRTAAACCGNTVTAGGSGAEHKMTDIAPLLVIVDHGCRKRDPSSWQGR